jgi:hypothetical protein
MPDSQLFVSGNGRYSDDFTKFRGADFINHWFVIWAIYEGHFEADGSRGRMNTPIYPHIGVKSKGFIVTSC